MKVQLTLDEIVEAFPNPYAVDYQSRSGGLDLYTDEELVKFARRLIDRINEKLQDAGHIHINS